MQVGNYQIVAACKRSELSSITVLSPDLTTWISDRTYQVSWGTYQNSVESQLFGSPPSAHHI